MISRILYIFVDFAIHYSGDAEGMSTENHWLRQNFLSSVIVAVGEMAQGAAK
jgi:hypothetical protein